MQDPIVKMAIEIVDLPMNSMVIVHSYVAVYQRLHLPRESIVILLTPLMWIDVITHPAIRSPASAAGGVAL